MGEMECAPISCVYMRREKFDRHPQHNVQRSIQVFNIKLFGNIAFFHQAAEKHVIRANLFVYSNGKKCSFTRPQAMKPRTPSHQVSASDMFVVYSNNITNKPKTYTTTVMCVFDKNVISFQFISTEVNVES